MSISNEKPGELWGNCGGGKFSFFLWVFGIRFIGLRHTRREHARTPPFNFSNKWLNEFQIIFSTLITELNAMLVSSEFEGDNYFTRMFRLTTEKEFQRKQ